MSQRTAGFWTGGLLVLGLGVGLANATHAAERSSTSRSKSKKSTEVTESSQLSFRLPRYFASIVDDDQRTKIREIQVRFYEKMAPLHQELAELEAAQLEAIEGLLRSDQRKTLEQLRAKSGSNSSTKRRSSTSGRSKTAKGGSNSKSTRSSPTKSRSSSSKSRGSSTKAKDSD